MVEWPGLRAGRGIEDATDSAVASWLSLPLDLKLLTVILATLHAVREAMRTARNLDDVRRVYRRAAA